MVLAGHCKLTIHANIRVLHHCWCTIDHFANEPFQAIRCTAADHQNSVTKETWTRDWKHLAIYTQQQIPGTATCTLPLVGICNFLRARLPHVDHAVLLLVLQNWNSFPSSLCDFTLTLILFCSRVKTHLYGSSYRHALVTVLAVRATHYKFSHTYIKLHHVYNEMRHVNCVCVCVYSRGVGQLEW